MISNNLSLKVSILFPRQRRSSSESGVAEFGHSMAVDWPVKRVAEIPGQAFKIYIVLFLRDENVFQQDFSCV